MEERMLIDFKRESLSKLAFIVVSDVYSDKEKNMANAEIKRRFSNSGCSREAFMETEEVVFAKRGDILSNYLFGNKPTGQLFMQLFLEKVWQLRNSEHGNLAFSEVLLCNNATINSFCTKALGIELKNLERRLANFQGEEKELNELKNIYAAIKERLVHSKARYNSSWSYNSYTDVVDDIVFAPSAAINMEEFDLKYGQRINEAVAEIEQGKKLAVFKMVWPLLIEGLASTELVDTLSKYRIVNSDLSRLEMQKRAIIESLKNGSDVDYSNLSEAALRRIR